MKPPEIFRIGLALAAALLGATPSAAEGPRYTYGQIGYLGVEFDDPEADGDAFDLGGSLAIADAVHLFAGYADGDLDIEVRGLGDISADYRHIVLGLGVNHPISDTIDLVGRLAYLGTEIESRGPDDDEDGYALGAGIRAMVTPRLELSGGITYTDRGGDFDSDTSLGLSAVYGFTRMVAGVAGVSFGDDAIGYRIALRLYFGDR